MIADDFTGALDTGAQLAKHQIKTRIAVNHHNICTDDKSEVLVVNADTRHDSPKDAYNKIYTMLERYGKQAKYIYIKTDSALRGNISAELYAAVSCLKRPLMLIPAYPVWGRTTHCGYQYVNGVLLENSVFHNDPLNPATDSFVPDIAARDYPVTSRIVKQDEIESFRSDTVKDDVCVFDCTDEDVMLKIAHKLQSEKLYGLTAGCAGFASTFSQIIPFSRQKSHIRLNDSPLLILSGSANEVTLRQLRLAQAQGYEVIRLSERLKCFPEQNKDELIAVVNRAQKCLSMGISIIIATAMNTEELSKVNKLPEAVSKALDIHANISGLFAELAFALIKNGASKNIAVFGGDTCLAILNKIGCTFAYAKGEVETGVPVCEASFNGNTIHLVTKSGGLGSDGVVKSIENYFRGK